MPKAQQGKRATRYNKSNENNSPKIRGRRVHALGEALCKVTRKKTGGPFA
jgi:hypothetical protein